MKTSAFPFPYRKVLQVAIIRAAPYIPLMVEPSEILRTALENRRNPWNWLMQALAVLCLCLALLFHSHALFVFFVVLAAVGLLNLKLPPMRDSSFRRFALAGLEREKSLMGLPPGWRRAAVWSGLAFAVVFVLWTLWSRSLLALCFVMGGAALGLIARSNRDNGISL